MVIEAFSALLFVIAIFLGLWGVGCEFEDDPRRSTLGSIVRGITIAVLLVCAVYGAAGLVAVAIRHYNL
jgi:hypothetical protein